MEREARKDTEGLQVYRACPDLRAPQVNRELQESLAPVAPGALKDLLGLQERRGTLDSQDQWDLLEQEDSLEKSGQRDLQVNPDLQALLVPLVPPWQRWTICLGTRTTTLAPLLHLSSAKMRLCRTVMAPPSFPSTPVSRPRSRP